jgi:hypothetical protein
MLIAVDGTESASWRNSSGSNSFVYLFFEDYQTDPGKKLYLDGPNNAKGLFSVEGIVHKGLSFFEECRKDGVDFDEEGIDFVGHSRGGLTVVRLAAEFEKKFPNMEVRFMGLYDAVDRCLWGTGSGKVSDNVLLVAHARRSKDAKSRTSFGNCATRGGQRYIEKFFKGTHSAIGGDPWGGDKPKGLTADSDKSAADGADAFIRKWAAQTGVPIS